MENLIQYFTALEGRLSALEEHNAQLEAQVAELQKQIMEMEAKLSTKDEEPEVEVELVFNEEEEEPEIPENLESPEEVETPEEPEIEAEEEETPATVETPAATVETPAATETPVTKMGAVTELRKAISLGDRFLFVRELFGGQGERLHIVIDELDKMESLEQAVAYLDRHFNWDKESKAYELFMNALQRRFS